MEAGKPGKRRGKATSGSDTPSKKPAETAAKETAKSSKKSEAAKRPGQTPPDVKDASPKPSAMPEERRKRLRWGIVSLAVLVAVIAWVVTRDNGGDSSEPTSSAHVAPHVVSVEELRESAATLGQPIYWAGPIPGKELVLKELDSEGVQVLYLAEGADPSKEASIALTIGSYPISDPAGAIETVAKKPGEIVRQAPDGRQVITSENSPTSVYFASPDNSVQVEVYDPSFQRAMNLALSGKVQPAG